MIAAAAAALCARRRAGSAIARRGAANWPRVPGRFERVDVGQPFTVIVDYAHTDDALRNLTARGARVPVAARRYRPRHHRLRLRRRPRPQQASADGRSGGTRQRLRGADQRQSAQRESARHHERRSARTAAQRHSVHCWSRTAARPSRWPSRSAARRHRADCRQRAREGADHQRRGRAVRRRRRGASWPCGQLGYGAPRSRSRAIDEAHAWCAPPS